MIDEAAASIPIWILIFTIFGYMMGEAAGDSRRHRKCLEETNQDLRDQLRRIYESHCTGYSGSNAAQSTTSTIAS